MQWPKHIHCVGVGGVGLSALAQLLQYQGAIVSGCDRSSSVVTEGLESKGVPVSIGHDSTHVSSQTGLLIYSDAIDPDNPERVRASQLAIAQLSYFEALGKIAENYKVIAVAGAHGKTSTTAMAIDVLEAAGLDPTAVVGSLRAKTKNNFRSGSGEYFVVEADEYRRHFLNFNPYILIITNVDADHLDYFKDLSEIQLAFRELAARVPKHGYIICDPAHPNVAPVVEGVQCQVINYQEYFDPKLQMNALPLQRKNAAAVLALANILHIDSGIAKDALRTFAGTWRRFEYKGKTKEGADVYDDYAHHPEEIKATLAGVREQFPNRTIVVAFHPHLYSRTKALLQDFATAFVDADEVVIAPIFAAREEPDPTITSDILAERIRSTYKNAKARSSFEEIETYLRDILKKGDILITMGAGDIYKVAEALTSR